MADSLQCFSQIRSGNIPYTPVLVEANIPQVLLLGKANYISVSLLVEANIPWTPLLVEADSPWAQLLDIEKKIIHKFVIILCLINDSQKFNSVMTKQKRKSKCTCSAKRNPNYVKITLLLFEIFNIGQRTASHDS